MWKVFMDSVSDAMRAKARIVIITPKGIRLEHSFKLGFRASNNEAEYEALLARLRVVLDLGAREVEIYSDPFDIKYRPKSSVVCHVDIQMWKVFMDNTSDAMRAKARIVIITPEGIRLEHSFKLGFRASNNIAEYEALLARSRAVLDLGAREVEIYSDSRLEVSQVQGNFEA